MGIDMRLQGKVAIVTGAVGDAGEAQARLFAREGAAVLLTDIRESEGRSLAADIAGLKNHTASFCTLDVTDEDAWRFAIKECVTRFGNLNVLVNNAGVIQSEPLLEITDQEWERVMAVNTKGVFLGTKHAIPAMKNAGGGSIINISSTSGLLAGGRGAAYGTSKGAIRTFTKYAAVQYSNDGIRSNSVHPGPFESEMIADILRSTVDKEASIARSPMGRLGKVEDVAYAALFLASDDSSYMTGSELVVDGGMTAQ
jgi:cyclopentanol dehydrogenase